MFQYCSFYGLSAPLLMVLSKETIDSMFEFPLTADAGLRLQNLHWELEKLKQLISDTNVVHTQVDESSLLATYLTQGLNAALSERESMRSTSSPAHELSTELSLDLGMDSDSDSNLNLLDLDTTTDLFSDLSTPLPDPTQPPSPPDLLADTNLLEVDLNDQSESNLLDMDMDLDTDMDLDMNTGEGLFESTAEVEIDETSSPAEEWVMPTDLVIRGRMYQPLDTDRFKDFNQLYRWFCTKARAEVGDENYKVLSNQLDKLPRRLSGRIIIDKRTHQLQEEYPELYSILNTIVTQAYSTIDGMSKIDYTLARVSHALGMSNSNFAHFLGVKYDMLKGMRTTYAYNLQINEKIIKGPISSPVLETRLQVIDKLLEDCHVLLGTQDKNKPSMSLREAAEDFYLDNERMLEAILTQQYIKDSGISKYRNDALEVLQMLRSRSSDAKNISALTDSSSAQEFIFLTRVKAAIGELTRDIHVKFGISPSLTSEELNQLGIKLARMFKIGGFYYGYEYMFHDTFRMTSRFVCQNNYTLTRDNEYYDALQTEVELLYVYLMSLKERLVNEK